MISCLSEAVLRVVCVCWQTMPNVDGKKPQAKHLQTRAEYLLKVLRKQAEFIATPVSDMHCLIISTLVASAPLLEVFSSFPCHTQICSLIQVNFHSARVLTVPSLSVTIALPRVASGGGDWIARKICDLAYSSFIPSVVPKYWVFTENVIALFKMKDLVVCFDLFLCEHAWLPACTTVNQFLLRGLKFWFIHQHFLYICSCSFRLPWPWCKVTVGQQRQKIGNDLSRQISKQ